MLNDGYKVELNRPTDEVSGYFDITGLVKGITWTNSISQAAGTMNLEALDTLTEKSLFINMPPGSKILLTKHTEEIFSGVVVKSSRTSDHSVSMNLTDNMFYLTKNMTTLVCDGIPGSQVIQEVLDKFKIPYHSLPKISVEIKEIFRDVSIWGIVDKIFKAEAQLTGVSWCMKWVNNGIEFFDLGTHRPKWILDSQTARLSGTSSSSMEKMYNNFVVRGKDDEIITSEVDSESVNKYGQMTYQVTDEEASKDKALQIIKTLRQQLNKLEESFSIECLGHSSIHSGDRVQISDDALKTYGIFEVTSVSHNVSSGLHKMSLQLRRCPDEG